MVSRALRHALRDVDSPAAVLDLEAFDANLEALAHRAHGLPVRLATKSLRVPTAIERALAHPAFSGLLAFSLPEALQLHARGADDVVVGYPTVDRAALRTLLADPGARRSVTLMIDSTEHLDLIEAAAGPADSSVPDPVLDPVPGPPVRVCIDVDASLRLGEQLLGDRAHIGARRSPLRDADAVLDLARRVLGRPGFRLVGLMAYEGQIAGTPDAGRSPVQTVTRALQHRSTRELAVRRRSIVEAVRGLTDLEFVNGGGTGSLESSASEGSLTEVAAGSGLFSPALFDGYTGFRHRSAAYFVSPVVRRPGPGWVTVFKGGFIASGPTGPERAPRVAWPEGLALAGLEGAGEVQTPLHGRAADALHLGELVWFRHAKAGELSEHFLQYLVVEGERIVDEWPTYRGMGWAP